MMLENSSDYSLMPFMFKGKRITTLVFEDGSTWFIAKECCDALENVNSRDTTKRHCKYAKLLKGRDSLPLAKSPYGITIIPESDLYRLITNAKTPKAEPFKDWLYEEVLPSIRNIGSYSINPAASGLDYFQQAISDPANLQEMFGITLQELQNKNRIIAAQGKGLSRRFNPRP